MTGSVLRKSILATLVYYDVFDYPLTAGEVFKFLINPERMTESYPHTRSDLVWADLPSRGRVGTPRSLVHKERGMSTEASRDYNFENLSDCLDALVKKGEVEEKNGFYFLSGRSLLYLERIERNKIAELKWKKTRRYLFWAQAVPYIETIFASGSLALGHTNQESDLDVLVVTKSGRIWLARTLLSLVMNLLGVRRKNKERVAPDKICLNHYITADSLKIPFASLYNAQTYAHLIPVFWRDENVIKKFWEENGGWVGHYLCRWELPDFYQKRAIWGSQFLAGTGRILEKVLDRTKLADWLEKFSRKIQVARIDIALPGRITVNDQQLEFHPYSIEKDIVEKYNQTISKLGIFGNYKEYNSGLR